MSERDELLERLAPLVYNSAGQQWWVGRLFNGRHTNQGFSTKEDAAYAREQELHSFLAEIAAAAQEAREEGLASVLVDSPLSEERLGEIRRKPAGDTHSAGCLVGDAERKARWPVPNEQAWIDSTQGSGFGPTPPQLPCALCAMKELLAALDHHRALMAKWLGEPEGQLWRDGFETGKRAAMRKEAAA